MADQTSLADAAAGHGDGGAGAVGELDGLDDDVLVVGALEAETLAVVADAAAAIAANLACATRDTRAGGALLRPGRGAHGQSGGGGRDRGSGTN